MSDPVPTPRLVGGALLAFTLMVGGVLTLAAQATAVPGIALATSADYAVLAATTVTNTGNSVLDGSLGLSPGGSIAGFPPGLVVPPGTTDVANAVALQAQPAAFARLGDLRPGDLIVVRDHRSGLDVRFAVTESATYSIDEARDPAVLARIHGVGPVIGTGPQPSGDGRAHLTLITCAGTFVEGTHDPRLVVYASRIA